MQLMMGQLRSEIEFLWTLTVLLNVNGAFKVRVEIGGPTARGRVTKSRISQTNSHRWRWVPTQYSTQQTVCKLVKSGSPLQILFDPFVLKRPNSPLSINDFSPKLRKGQPHFYPQPIALAYPPKRALYRTGSHLLRLSLSLLDHLKKASKH